MNQTSRTPARWRQSRARKEIAISSPDLISALPRYRLRREIHGQHRRQLHCDHDRRRDSQIPMTEIAKKSDGILPAAARNLRLSRRFLFSVSVTVSSCGSMVKTGAA
ncbi:hypothetical protein TIFTF001_026709 [Ficus carica]|uniref:Uncharacterized protein n=1 Tax=Ficus carica TaxID=3494 RepID=A0AA88DLQ2_FICCA|nr:hypothetical protein TIFTF001_026709 [Ficus carica]